MGRKLTCLLAVGALLALAIAPGAPGALRVAGHQAVKRASPARDAAGGSLIASPAACPRQESAAAGAEAQLQAMRCMTNFARARAGLGPLSDSPQLDLSAREKAADLLACDSFSHQACGREFTYWMREAGYLSAPCWHVGENLAWGSAEFGTVRSIFRAWMRSPDHRRNVLGDYSQLGLDLTAGELEGQPGAHVWTAHFGSRCEGQP
jgi:uncharacterized protein YkwD